MGNLSIKYIVKSGCPSRKEPLNKNGEYGYNWKFVWPNKCLPIINDFLWVLAHNKQLTLENIAKRECHSISVLYKEREDTSYHLLSKCKCTKEALALARIQ